MTKNASFAIALATEMMIQHLATTTHNVVKAERKPRRNIQYRDVSGAVAKTDNLEFLVDVVPRTTTYGAFRKRKEAEKEKEKEVADKAKEGDQSKSKETDISNPTNGTTQTTLPSIPIDSQAAQSLLAEAAVATPTPTPQNGTTELDPLARKEIVPVPDAMDVDVEKEERVADSEGEEDPAAMQIEMEMRGPARTNGNDESGHAGPSASTSARVSSGGFTAINGR